MKLSDQKWLGIDYGNKLKGTTAAAFEQDGAITIRQSEERQDADQWLIKLCREVAPSQVFIDAPLSLPLAYFSPDEASDYFYRQCDRAIGGMSPLFLGALTARAIKLKRELEEMGVEVWESYPVGLAKELLADQMPTNKEDPKKQKLWRLLTDQFPATLHDRPANQHQVDALLTWWIGYRYQQDEHRVIGNPEEGVVVI